MAPPTPATIAALLRLALAQGQRPVVTVTSDSMAPLLRRGDQVQLETASAESLAAGDVIVVLTPENLLTHRYWGTIKDQGARFLVTRGDRPLGFDRPAQSEHLIGRVASRMRRGRELDLRKGRGQRLNRRLASLARREARLFGAEMPLSVANLCPAPRLSNARRAVRGLFYGWASLLVAATR